MSSYNGEPEAHAQPCQVLLYKEAGAFAIVQVVSRKYEPITKRLELSLLVIKPLNSGSRALFKPGELFTVGSTNGGGAYVWSLRELRDAPNVPHLLDTSPMLDDVVRDSLRLRDHSCSNNAMAEDAKPRRDE